MGKGKPFTQIDKSVNLPPLEVGRRVVRPVARLKGWYFAAGEQEGGGAGAALRLTPTEVVVQEGESSYSVAIVDPLPEPLRKLLFSGMAVSALCLLMMLAGRRLAQRRTKLD